MMAALAMAIEADHGGAKQAAGGLRYGLITPARNEAEYIENTLRSVTRQTTLPARWVIVDDGSTDSTADLVRWYAERFTWIELVSLPPRAERHFAGKVCAFEAGYARLQAEPFEVVGSLDADISFDPDFMATLLEKFVVNPKLGIAGAPFTEEGKSYDFRFASVDHVSGACQLFRRRCYEAIGGYNPVKGGGIDVIAVLTARMLGWETRTFEETHCVHHRPEGTAARSVLKARFRDGEKDYVLGSHPAWQLFRATYQLGQKPYVARGVAILSGYLWAMVRRQERVISPELMRYRRRDQMRRLRALLVPSLASRSARNSE